MQEEGSHNEEKNQPKETDPKMTLMIEFNKDTKTISHIQEGKGKIEHEK